MPEVEITSPSLSPSTLAGATEAATLIAESNETPTSPTVTALAEDTRRDRREGAMEEQAADRILGGSTGAREIGGEMAAKGEGLVILEEAVDDGAVVNTVGTLIVTELEVTQACQLPLNSKYLFSRLLAWVTLDFRCRRDKGSSGMYAVAIV